MPRFILQALMALSMWPCSASAGYHVDAVEVDPSSVTHGQYSLVNIHPHNTEFFTEGLLFHNGVLLESTGLDGASYIREIGPNFTVTKEFRFPPNLFGEGIAVLDNKIYALTYKSKTGFILDRDTFEQLGTFHFETTTGEGWGMTTDGTSLIVSDGSSAILFFDPTSMAVTRSIQVSYATDGSPVDLINELEYVNGELLANVWFTNDVLRIDPSTGRVREVLNMDHLPTLEGHVDLMEDATLKNDAVMNGIAYNPANGHVYMTGKLWDSMFEVDLNVPRRRIRRHPA
ncbi:Aste57867_12716 [Aphanomyces stellatus]|uniref:Aste57867_12716 protein n=1 Tax=Aphanomyces stellatus TaxID=120398 RepID=A0A485KWB0_9STRA|nr:hypothetical protein As57867_012668 [Aphanomyces stellatus]VFT89566.1 Aste57867_12716 [Aphanomyces stellatus]